MFNRRYKELCLFISYIKTKFQYKNTLNIWWCSSVLFYLLTRTIIPQIVNNCNRSVSPKAIFLENKNKLVIYQFDFKIFKHYQIFLEYQQILENFELRKLSEWISNDYNSNYADMKRPRKNIT